MSGRTELDVLDKVAPLRGNPVIEKAYRVIFFNEGIDIKRDRSINKYINKYNLQPKIFTGLVWPPL